MRMGQGTGPQKVSGVAKIIMDSSHDEQTS